MFIYSLNPPTPARNNDYIAAIIDKHRRLDSLPSPKVIFVGSSSLAFGLNSKLIEDSLGMPVVNMGLHGGLGIDFILNETRANIRSGDIVILSLEYYLGGKGDAQLQKRVIEVYPEAEHFMETQPQREIINNVIPLNDIRAYIRRIQITAFHGAVDNAPKAPNFGYRRGLFSEYGDVVNEFNTPLPKELKDGNFGKADWSDYIKKTNAFADFVRAQGAKIYFMYPSFPESMFEKRKDAITFLANQYNTSLRIEIINAPEDFVFPDSDFLDTVYHLTKEAREKRTLRLLPILRAHLSMVNRQARY